MAINVLVAKRSRKIKPRLNLRSSSIPVVTASRIKGCTCLRPKVVLLPVVGRRVIQFVDRNRIQSDLGRSDASGS